MKKTIIKALCMSLLIAANADVIAVCGAENNIGDLPLNAAAVQNGQWKMTTGKQYTYLDGEGNLIKGGFIKDNNKVYCFDADGFLCTGVIYTKNEGDIYATDDNGALYCNSWGKVDNSWMYFGNEYKCMKDYWISDNGNWYYLKNDGIMATGWQQIGGSWYYFNDSGIMLKDTYVGTYRLNSEGIWEK